MSKAKKGDKVQVHYTGKLKDGKVFDTSNEREPLEFTIGKGEVIPGFENAVVGMDQGESKSVTIPADEAYGPHREEMVVEVEREKFPENLNPEIGQQLQVRLANGKTTVVTVTNVSDDTVKLDANHPLAGKDLVFDVELVTVV